ncbi:MAG: hypothetical protein GY896_21815, partial [Gammaproteobacteria bacterium]|nr:hypothetical protein [Gammaproteobacteria bacterium]
MSACGGGDGDSSSTRTGWEVNELVPRTGPIVAVRVDEVATLDGSRSYIDATSPSSQGEADDLNYHWSFSYKPDESKAVLQNAGTARPSFVADVRGVYIVQIELSYRGLTSNREIQIVIATVAPERPTGRYFHQGLSSNCTNCHNGSLPLISGGVIQGKSSDHLATSNVCEGCHSPLGFSDIVFVDHMENFGTCSECHNNVLAIGQSDQHLKTDAECDACHTTRHFVELQPDGSYDHSNVSTFCSSCHNGMIAAGKHATHLDTDFECGTCHNTESFIGAFPNHLKPPVVGSRCDSCHDGNDAVGPMNGHPLVSVDCAVCHDIDSFDLNGQFDHGLVDSTVQSCQSCHVEGNVINALTKSDATNHVTTSADCGACHNTERFTGAFVDHTSAAVVSARCDTCHGVSSVGKPMIGHLDTTEDCGVCHTPGTFASGFFDHAPSYLKAMSCASCHDDVISFGKGVNHLPTVEDCGACHNTDAFV